MRRPRRVCEVERNTPQCGLIVLTDAPFKKQPVWANFRME